MTHTYGKSLLPATVGFDRLFSTMEELDKMLGATKAPTYPPYNIVKFDNYNYEIQIAVAGFGQDDISVETNHNKLYVSGVSEKSELDGEYLHHGLAKRDFKHVFTLSDTSVVNSAEIKDGILKISIENVIPESMRPRKIPIGIPQQAALLTEDKAEEK
jgi:molecular chaperone IbpA